MRKAFGLVALMLVAVATSGSAHAAPKSVAAGEVSTSIVRQNIDLPALLRASLDEEIRTLDTALLPLNKSYVVSLSLVRLEADPSARGASVTCVVSAALRDTKGVLRAVLEGRVHAETDGRQVDLERVAMRNAIHGAVTRVPSALR